VIPTKTPSLAWATPARNRGASQQVVSSKSDRRIDRIPESVRKTDSIYLLDADSARVKNAAMESAELASSKLQMLILERRYPAKNVARFYVLAIEATLFGDAALVREWGRLGLAGRRRIDLHPDDVSAREALELWLQRKQNRGYRLRE
jgi:predicted DNA-binding WGR domain protein